MIKQIHIQNFKSIYDLTIEVSRVNVFIGENGSGKSNLLEALVFASASDANLLANEFLVSRGLRVPEPALMRSAFDKKAQDNSILMEIEVDNVLRKYNFYNENDEYSVWEDFESKKLRVAIAKLNVVSLRAIKLLKNDTESIDSRVKKYQEILESLENKIEIKINNFIIYSPENTALRTFEKENQIQPLGINGEGLLKLLKVINNYKDKGYINTIIQSLQLFNWFEGITIPSTISSLEQKVVITDKYLYREIDQRSANEGFLFILFYIALIVAKETPQAFAIDNIDASLNPKLCTKLMTILVELAEKYDKQLFLTTHNPAILDGIDLNDDEQKLFVVSRNKKGHTRMKTITAKDKPKSSDDEPLHLSEAFMRGYLGGLPKGF